MTLCYVIICIFWHVPLLVTGAAVKLAETKGAPLDQLTLEDLLSLHSSFEADVAALWSYEYRYCSLILRDNVRSICRSSLLELTGL